MMNNRFFSSLASKSKIQMGLDYNTTRRKNTGDTRCDTATRHATRRHDMRHKRHEVRHERHEVRHERHEMRHERHEVRHERHEIRHERHEVRHERKRCETNEKRCDMSNTSHLWCNRRIPRIPRRAITLRYTFLLPLSFSLP